MKPQHFAAIFVRSIAFLGTLVSGYFFLSAYNLSAATKANLAQIKKIEASWAEPSLPFPARPADDQKAREEEKTRDLEIASYESIRRLQETGALLLVVSILLGAFSKTTGRILSIGIATAHGDEKEKRG